MTKGLKISTEDAMVTISLHGGCITSFSLPKINDGFDVLRPLAQNTDLSVNPFQASSFPLVPYSNRIKNGSFSFNGKAHQLPFNFGEHTHSIHGIGWELDWCVTHHDETSLTLELLHEGQDWPYKFRCIQIFSLNNNSLTNEVSVINHSGEPMPTGLGMHPYFPRHGKAKLTAEVQSVWMTDETCLPTGLITCPEQWNLSVGADVDKLLCDNQFEPWQGMVRIDWPETDMALELTASENLGRLVVFAPEGENFFCVEPVSHMTDAFNRTDAGMTLEQTGMKILEPGEMMTAWMKLTPIQL